MTANAVLNQSTFDRMVRSFCSANHYKLIVDQREDYAYRYLIKNKELKRLILSTLFKDPKLPSYTTSLLL